MKPLEIKKTKRDYAKYLSMDFIYTIFLPTCLKLDVSDSLSSKVVDNLYELFDYYAVEKYSKNNFKKEFRGKNMYYNSLTRHIIAHNTGEVYDTESSFPHILHAIANLNMLVDELIRDKRESLEENDDLITGSFALLVVMLAKSGLTDLSRRVYKFNKGEGEENDNK